MAEGQVGADPLFVGLTRPALLFGVSMPYFMLNSMVCFIAYIVTTKFSYLAVSVPIHFFGYYLCSKEPLFIELFMIRSRLCNRSLNKIFHGANSYDPY